MYAAAFFESDPRKVVEAGLACLPSQSRYAAILRDVLEWTRPGGNWRRVWRQLEETWDKDDSCPDGAGQPFNIDAKLNGAYIGLALLMGDGDFAKTLEIAVQGDFLPDGGRADVYLDGKLQARGIDAYVAENTFDNVLWHAYGMSPGAHVLRIVVRDDADPRSAGRKLVIRNAVVYQAS